MKTTIAITLAVLIAGCHGRDGSAALISAVADESQRTELGQKYDALRGELEAA